ncbi:MAG: lipopolysaccharide heptosyltransferase I, partial [Proteobacteria bacterium]|nr:lipopolysaccharide heptosyltransferase I [Pseudomonadota bacterium]
KKHRYDLVIDSQGLIKSAVLAKLAGGPSCGFGAGYARERLAGMSYKIGINIDCDQHMLDRCRRLAASALSYQVPDKLNYGLIKSNTPSMQSNKVLILCSSAQTKKLWPTNRWVEICRYLSAIGFECQYTWGDQTGRAICEQIASSAGGEIMPKMHLGDVATLLNQSRLVVGLDTGLLHLAAALEVPLVSIHGASDPLKTGPKGNGIMERCGSKNCFPDADEVKSALTAITTIIRDGALN